MTLFYDSHNMWLRIRNKKEWSNVLLAKNKLHSIELLITKVLSDSYISQDEFVLVKNISKEYDDMKEVKSFKKF